MTNPKKPAREWFANDMAMHESLEEAKNWLPKDEHCDIKSYVDHSIYEQAIEDYRRIENHWRETSGELQSLKEELQQTKIDLRDAEVGRTRLRQEIDRLNRIIAKELSENDELGAEYTYVNVLKRENERFRMALKEIAKCEVIIDGDCPSIALLALEEK